MDSSKKTLLEALNQKEVKRSKIGKIRELFEEIEEAKRTGVSNADLVTVLNERGIDVNLKTFENMLYRIRQEKVNKPIPTIQKTRRVDKTKELPTPERTGESKLDGGSLYPEDDWLVVGVSNTRLIEDLHEQGFSPEDVREWGCSNDAARRNKLTEFINKKSKKRG